MSATAGEPPLASTPAKRKTALVSFGVVMAVNTLAIAIWVPIGWSLRGSSYEPGRPSAEDLHLMWMMRGVHVCLLLANLAYPALLAARRRWPALAGVGAAWLCLPLSYLLGLLLMAIAVRLFFP